MSEKPESRRSGADLDDVLADYLCRFDRGERVDQAAFIASHPHLANELREYFSHAAAIGGETSTAHVNAANRATPHSGLEVRCPNCHQPTKVAVDTTLTDLTCSACGSHFSLVDQSQATRIAPALTSLGRFELIERIGIGGFGSVWKARDKELDRTVAIKIPREGAMTPEEQEKFFREARAAAQLRHSNIVSVHEVGREGDSVYIVSDFVRGVTLGDWLTGQKLTSREAANLCARIADALDHAHEQGVVHRDLKPANIMMDFDGQPHLMDFGLARREVGEVTVTVDGHVLGTPAYMSPEQAEGKAHTADRRSDIYSLGVILFQMLTGELPFRGNARMLIYQVLHDDAPSPRKFNAHIRKDLETIVLKCLQKDVNRRYQAARDVASELRRYLCGEPILARPVTRVERAWRWARRHPQVAGLSAALLVLLTGLAIVGPGIAIQQAAQRKKYQELAQTLDETNTDLKENLARNLVERASGMYQMGNVSEGIALLAAAYETAPVGNPLRDSARRLISAWSVQAGNAIVQDAEVMALACASDGATMLTICGGRVYLWDLRTRTIIGAPIEQEEMAMTAEFSPDGNKVFTAGTDGKVRLWDANTRQLLKVIECHKDVVDTLAISPDGKTLLSGSRDGWARLWNVETAAPIGEPMHHELGVYAVTFTPDGNTAITAGWDAAIRFWDPRTGLPKLNNIQLLDKVAAIAVSPDGSTVVAGGLDFSARSFRIQTGEQIGEVMHHNDEIRALAFSPDGRFILTGSWDATARLWDASTGKPFGEPFRHRSSVNAVGFAPRGNSLITGSTDRTTRIWRVPTSDPLHSLQPDHDEAYGPVADVAVSPNGQRILSAMDSRAIQWDTKSYSRIGKVMLHSGLNGAVFAPDGLTLATFGIDWNIQLWNAVTCEPIGKPLRHDGPILDAEFSPDGQLLAAVCQDGCTARLWNARTSNSIGAPLQHQHHVAAIAFTPDGRAVVTGCYDGTGSLWSVETCEQLRPPLQFHESINAIAVSPDGKSIATGGRFGACRIWNADTFKPASEIVQHGGDVDAVAFSHDGHFLLTGSADGTSRLLDATTCTPVAVLRHPDKVRAVAFTPHDDAIITACHDGITRVWPGPPDALPDDPRFIRAWTTSFTGLSLDDEGMLQVLSPEEWQATQQYLTEMGRKEPSPQDKPHPSFFLHNDSDL